MNEDQMNDAARAIALEEAARICDDLTWAIDNAGQRYRREALASKCAEAIRERANVALATPAPAQPDPLHVANERGEGEPVAWRYARNGNRVEFHAHRLDHFYWDDIKQDYIKGTPLYLRPCRPAKVIPNSVESDGFKADARLLPSAAAPTSPTPAQEGKT